MTPTSESSAQTTINGNSNFHFCAMALFASLSSFSFPSAVPSAFFGMRKRHNNNSTLKKEDKVSKEGRNVQLCAWKSKRFFLALMRAHASTLELISDFPLSLSSPKFITVMMLFPLFPIRCWKKRETKSCFRAIGERFSLPLQDLRVVCVSGRNFFRGISNETTPVEFFRQFTIEIWASRCSTNPLFSCLLPFLFNELKGGTNGQIQWHHLLYNGTQKRKI